MSSPLRTVVIRPCARRRPRRGARQLHLSGSERRSLCTTSLLDHIPHGAISRDATHSIDVLHQRMYPHHMLASRHVLFSHSRGRFQILRARRLRTARFPLSSHRSFDPSLARLAMPCVRTRRATHHNSYSSGIENGASLPARLAMPPDDPQLPAHVRAAQRCARVVLVLRGRAGGGPPLQAVRLCRAAELRHAALGGAPPRHDA